MLTTKVLLQLGLDGRTIIGSGSYTEIGLHVFRKKRKNERKNVESI